LKKTSKKGAEAAELFSLTAVAGNRHLFSTMGTEAKRHSNKYKHDIDVMFGNDPVSYPMLLYYYYGS
jgi:hypothetical protein